MVFLFAVYCFSAPDLPYLNVLFSNFSVIIKRLHINFQEKIQAAFHMIAIELQSLPSLLLSATKKKKLRDRRDRTNIFLSDSCRNDPIMIVSICGNDP